ncbi:MAG: TonB-dependent receptor [Saprospiraceae bacterium]
MRYFPKIILLFLPLLFSQNIVAQTFNINGEIISSENNEPIIGATILIKGTTTGEATDLNGAFNLAVKRGKILIISAVGHETKEIKVLKEEFLKIKLNVSTSSLDEVVVVGYGIQKRGEITGSIASINADQLGQINSLSIDNAITGKLPGVLVQSSNGVPGSATSILIRGFSSLSDDANNPLIVVDGVPVYGTGKDFNNIDFDKTAISAASFGGNQVSEDFSSDFDRNDEFERNPLAHLNPEDIESIEILKDAFATAIYGSRGAAGVILITTKKGRGGKPQINFNYNAGRSKAIALPDLLSASEYAAVYGEFNKQRGFPINFPKKDSTDWFGEVTRPAWHQSANLSISGGDKKHQYFVSGGYMNQDAIIINNGFERYSAKINFANNSGELFRYGTDVAISFTQNSSLNASRIYKEAVVRAPNIPVKDDAGNYIWGAGDNPYGLTEDSGTNPVADATRDINELKDTRTIGRIFFEIQPIQWLVFKTQFGADLLNSLGYSRRRSRPIIPGGDAVETNTQNRRIVMDNTLTFQKTFSDHHINALLGHSFEKSIENKLGVSGRDFFSEDILSIEAANNFILNNAQQRAWALQSFFSRINYQYLDKYLAGVTYRIDGSSQFSRESRYVHFPSFSLGWRISKEAFMENMDWLKDLKLRSSIGFSGNPSSGGGFYGNQGQFVLQTNNLQYAGSNILTTQQPSNPNLKWERNRVIDAGIDLTLKKDQLVFTLDYYHKKTTNLLFASSLPYYTGWSSQLQNIGDMVNQGWEMRLESNQVFGDVAWSSTLNMASNSNKIKKLNFDGESLTSAENGYKYFTEGEPAGQFFLFQWQGVDPETGNPIWLNADGEETTIPPGSENETAIRNLSRRAYGTHLPDVFGGWDNTIFYKGFSLRAFFSYALGGQLINGTRAQLLTYSLTDANNLSREVLDYWQVEGDETDIPRLINASIRSSSNSLTDFTASRTSSRFLENASFVRLKDLTFSYRFLGEKLERLKYLSRLEIYLQATNIWTWTKYSGLDPEVSDFGSSTLRGGYDELTMPQLKSIVFGVKVGL